VIRLSRTEKPRFVQLNWSDSDRRKASVSIVLENGTLRLIEDSPIDCPEYLCFYSASERDSRIESFNSQLRMCREVVVHDGISEKSATIGLLESIKEKLPERFLRSFAFIMSVKRNERSLQMYNWNPQFAKR
jgi:hypothetical protein